MTLDDAYRLGFEKAAEKEGLKLEDIHNFLSGSWNGLKDWYKGLDANTRKTLVGGALLGTGSFLGSNGSLGDRLVNALGIGGLGAAAIYNRGDIYRFLKDDVYKKHVAKMLAAANGNGSAQQQAEETAATGK